MIKIVEAIEPDIITTDILRERATSSKLERSHQFLAYLNNIEAGYMSFDKNMDLNIGVLYDLLVLPTFQKRGIGSALIRASEEFFKSLGYNRIRVFPKAFDNSINQESLEFWYKRQGYMPANDGTQEFEKFI